MPKIKSDTAKGPKPELEMVLSGEEISRRVQELGRQISQDLGDKNLVVIGVLKGAFIFMSDLVRTLSVPAELDFVRLKSYGNETASSGRVSITKDVEPELVLKDKNVLIVEDIVDTGLTLAFLKEHLTRREPARVSICALIDKLERRERHVELDYVGFTVKKGFLVGYGLDAGERFRHRPDIYQLKREAKG